MEVRKPSEAELKEWHAEFEAAAKRSLEERMKYAFIKTYKPVLDDAPSRSFETMEEYRQWCESNLPRWLGYHRVDKPSVEDASSEDQLDVDSR